MPLKWASSYPEWGDVNPDPCKNNNQPRATFTPSSCRLHMGRLIWSIWFQTEQSQFVQQND
jgi:hypothetical protein